MNKVKQFMNKITDKTNGSQSDSPSTPTFLDTEDQHSAEGFLCPLCMTAFSSPEILADHYQKEHDDTAANEETASQDSSLQAMSEFQARREIIELQSALAEEKIKSNEMQREMVKIQSELRSRKNSESSMRSQSQQEEAFEDPKHILMSEIEKLKKRLSTEVDQVGQLRLEKEILTRNVNVYAAQVEQLKGTVADLEDQMSLKNSGDRETDSALLRDQLGRMKELMDEKTSAQEAKVSELTQQLALLESTTQENTHKEKNKVETLKAAYEKNMKELQARNSRNESMVQELTTAAEAIQRDLTNRERELSEAQNSFTLANQECEDLREAMKRLSEQHDELYRKIESGVDGNSAARDALHKENEALKQESDSLSTQLRKVAVNVNNLKLELEKLSKDHLDEKKKIILDFEELTSARRAELEEARSKERLQSELHTAERTSWNVKLEELTKQLKSKGDELEIVNTKIQQATNAISDRECEIVKLKSEIVEKSAVQKTLEASISSSKNMTAELEEKVSSLSEQLKTTTAQMSELRASNESLVRDLKQKTEELNAVAESFRQSESLTKDLKEQLLGAEAGNDKKDKEIKLLENKLKSMEEYLKGILKKNDEATMQFQAQKASLEEQLAKLQEDTEAQIQDLLRRLDDMGSEKTEYESRIEHLVHLVGETDKIRAEKMDLEKKYKSSEEGKSLLLERCLLGEANFEKLGDTVNDLRRKLDDSQSALKELGRENQSLQVESAKLQGRKWADDSVVNNCSTCTKEFSLTIRKHHCRGCGNIFCNDCSARTASVPSSKKPVRVCDACYDELTSK